MTRRQRRYVDRMYRDGLKEMALKALDMLAKAGKFLGRYGLRLIKVILRAGQVFAALDTIVSTAGLIRAKTLLSDGNKAIGLLDGLLMGAAGFTLGADAIEPPSGMKMALHIAVKTLSNAFFIAIREVGVRLANAGIEKLS